MLPIIALLFLIAGLTAGKVAKYIKNIFKDFLQGLVAIAPSGILILMAMSVNLIITNGRIIYTILYCSTNFIEDKDPYTAILIIFGLVLILSFFIGSGTAKTFLVIPLIAPLLDLIGISRQTCVQAFLLADGFSNLFYPTYPVLMIILGVNYVSYIKWVKWIYKLQLVLLIVSIIALFIAVRINYGPY